MKSLNSKSGFTLIEVLVGTAILVILMVGLYGLFQLTLKIVNQSKARITASALANQKIETARNLPYNQIGTLGGIPPGNIPETENILRNGISYTLKTTIGYVDDDFDGMAPVDTLPNDYKRIKVKVSWSGFWGGEIFFMSDISPKGLETGDGGGNLLINAFDALGAPIPQANIHLINHQTDPAIDANYQTNDQGQYLIAGAPSSTAAYQIRVTKNNYSTDRTYGTEEVANPDKPHATVLEGKLTEMSFSIDRLASFDIQTLSPWGSNSFSDSFPDTSKISESSNILVEQGQISLEIATGTEYFSSGNLSSIGILPGDVVTWDKLSWTDTEPLDTDIKYQLYYATGTNWFLIPDAALPNNSIGFDTSPVDLSALATTTYSQLKIKANLSTNNTSTTPILFDWALTWITGEATPIGYVSFNLQGNKTIGTDGSENPVYKYSDDFTTNASGLLNISGLEWDAYDFTIDPTENLDLFNTDPISDPLGQNIDLLPNTNQLVKLFLEAENSLFLTLRNQETSEPVFSGQVRLYNTGLSYDQTQFTDENGQTLFIPLETASYNIEIQADGYDNYSGQINVSGDKIRIINLTPFGPS